MTVSTLPQGESQVVTEAGIADPLTGGDFGPPITLDSPPRAGLKVSSRPCSHYGEEKAEQ